MKQLNKILLIEDQEIDAFLSKSILNQMGIANEIIICKNGEQALELLNTLSAGNASEQERVDLILLDIIMPGMDGFEFLQELRETYQQQYTVVMLSSSEDTSDITKAARFQAGYYLVKPLTIDKVKKMVARCFAPLHSSKKPAW